MKIGKEQTPAKMAVDAKDLDQNALQLDSLAVSPEKMQKARLQELPRSSLDNYNEKVNLELADASNKFQTFYAQNQKEYE